MSFPRPQLCRCPPPPPQSTGKAEFLSASGAPSVSPCVSSPWGSGPGGGLACPPFPTSLRILFNSSLLIVPVSFPLSCDLMLFKEIPLLSFYGISGGGG